MTQSSDQNATSAQLSDLQKHETDVQLRTSDLEVQIGQLREQQSQAGPDGFRFQRPLADLQHELTAARLDYEATHGRVNALQGELTTTAQHSRDVLFGREQLEMTGVGVFLLLIPIVFAMSRRIWARGGVGRQVVVDLESSPRLQRLEMAIDSIALEVERIGEAQRFANKLLVERRPEAGARVPSANAQRDPGMITPH